MGTMRFFDLTVICAVSCFAAVSSASAATYQINPITLGCSSDCRNIRGGAVTPDDVVSVSGTITTDSDAGFIAVSNIVDWELTFSGPENADQLIAPSQVGAELIPPFNLGGFLLTTEFSDTFFTALGGVSIFADGSTFAVDLFSNGPDTTSTFQFKGLAEQDYGVFQAPINLSFFTFILSTNASGDSDLDQAVGVIDLAQPIGKSGDSGAFSSAVGSRATVLSGGVVANSGSVALVPLPAAGGFLLAAMGVLAVFARRRV